MSADLLELRYVCLSQVRRWSRNPKRHDIGAIAASIEKHGFKDPPKYEPALNDGQGGLVEGNGRDEALEMMQKAGRPLPRGVALAENGEWAMPILFGVDAPSRLAAEAYALDHNTITLLGGDLTAGQIAGIYDRPGYLSLLGEMADYNEIPASLDEGDMQAFLAELERQQVGAMQEGEARSEDEELPVDPDRAEEIAALVADLGVAVGQLWALGDHRLLIGDATDPADAHRLLGERRPNLCVTDPPYGVNYDPSHRQGLSARFEGLMDSPLRQTTRVTADDRADWRGAWRYFPGNVLYTWLSDLHRLEVEAGVVAAGFILRTVIVWAKQIPVMSRGHYHWQHEPCLYAVRKGAEANWQGDRTQTTIWAIKNLNPVGQGGAIRGDDAKMGHDTQKPLACMARPIINHTRPGAWVYDPFVGSGTTVIACQRLDRLCLAMDIEPAAAAMTIARWQKLTGGAAIVIAD